MKVAITFWGTESYLNFLPEWYGRLEKYFLPDVEKHYFVFTDGELEGMPDNITVMEIPHYGFPDTFYKTFGLKFKKVAPPTKLNFNDFIKNTSIATSTMMIKRKIAKNIKGINSTLHF